MKLFEESSNIAIWRDNNKTLVELIVDDLEKVYVHGVISTFMGLYLKKWYLL